jgi:hypothetical protein
MAGRFWSSLVRKWHESEEESAQAVTRRVVGRPTPLLTIRQALPTREAGSVRAVTGNSLADAVKFVTLDGFLASYCGVGWGYQDPD